MKFLEMRKFLKITQKGNLAVFAHLTKAQFTLYPKRILLPEFHCTFNKFSNKEQIIVPICLNLGNNQLISLHPWRVTIIEEEVIIFHLIKENYQLKNSNR